MIVNDRAAAGTRHVATSVPLIVLRIDLPLTKVTSTATLISDPAKTTSGVRPVTAIVNSLSSGAAVLHVKSLPPPITTDDSIAATTGSDAVTLTANAEEVIFGEKVNSVTSPADAT